jgi:hypothetical protein
MQNSQVHAGSVYEAEDHGRLLRVRVVSRSETYPGTWVCEDLDRGETTYLTADQLKALKGGGS